MAALLLGLFIVSFITILLWKQFVLHHRIESVQSFTEQLSHQVINERGSLLTPQQIEHYLMEHQSSLNLHHPLPIVLINSDGKLAFPTKEISNHNLHTLAPTDSILHSLMEIAASSDTSVTRKKLDIHGNSYIIASPLSYGTSVLGRVFVILPEQEMQYNFSALDWLLISAATGVEVLFGWGVIYFLTKRMVQPVEQVVGAARQLMQGNYHIVFKEEIREKEIDELMNVFQELAKRLKQLESLRTILLAGVTHELKTPVASISGLLQAIADGVVQEDEKNEFTHMSLKETQKLQRMVEDLLDFNGIATGALITVHETLELLKFLEEVAYQWQITQEEHRHCRVEINSSGLTEPVHVLGDPLRIQQILFNLLNNSFQAMDGKGAVSIRIYPYDADYIGIDVADHGRGIPAEEQVLIFEHFYRGNEKKYAVRGLGIGLPYSLMLAKAQNGNLTLRESTEKGTIFTLTLPFDRPKEKYY